MKNIYKLKLKIWNIKIYIHVMDMALWNLKTKKFQSSKNISDKNKCMMLSNTCLFKEYFKYFQIKDMKNKHE